MARKQTKRSAREYAIALSLALLIVWLLFLMWGIATKEEIARKAVESRKSELAVLEARRDVLEGNLEELSTVRGQEATIRQTYGVARPGEEVIIVVPPKEEPVEAPRTWWKKTLNWFGIW